MRPRGNRLQPEHVLFLFLSALLITTGILLSKNRDRGFDEIEEVSYGRATIGKIDERPVDNIGQRWSPKKEAQIQQLNQKLYHDLELRTIE